MATAGIDPVPDETYLMRFEDGPLSRAQNVGTLAGTSGNFAVPKEAWDWPLPDRLGALVAGGHAAMWDADRAGEAGLPAEVICSPNAVLYRKISESQLQEDVPHVVRGALYQLEASAHA